MKVQGNTASFSISIPVQLFEEIEIVLHEAKAKDFSKRNLTRSKFISALLNSAVTKLKQDIAEYEKSSNSDQSGDFIGNFGKIEH